MRASKRTIEMIVKMAGILLLIVALGFVRPVESLSYARNLRVQSDLAEIRTRLNDYKRLNGFYPTSEQGLDSLITKPQSSPIPEQWIQHCRNVPTDAWQSAYVYCYPSSKDPTASELFSLGPDRVESGDDIHLLR
jgi:general secretion pathway protein G